MFFIISDLVPDLAHVEEVEDPGLGIEEEGTGTTDTKVQN